MKKVIVAAVTLAVLMSGCVQKKDVPMGGDGKDYTSAAHGTYGENTTTYENVDPYGSGNGTYGNGTYGENSTYGDNGAYTGADNIQNIYFGIDQYTITSEKLATISQNSRVLKSNMASGAKVKIEGHCDASGSDEYNYALGLRRAKAAKDALIMKGVNQEKISLVSMGESSPECASSSSESCYSKNRRVEFKVLP